MICQIIKDKEPNFYQHRYCSLWAKSSISSKNSFTPKTASSYLLSFLKQVHQSSTDAASSLLVTALNEGRDVIMDGTLSWEPFVEQTIAMARDVHKHRYRMGVGYKVADDGTVTENYWEQIEEGGGGEEIKIRKPYRIELVGVVCDAYLAVVRGIRYHPISRHIFLLLINLQVL